MAANSILRMSNLTTYDGLIKTYIAEADAKSYKTISFDESTRVIKFYKTDTVTTETVADYSVTLPDDVDISGLMSKITGGTVGNVVTVAADGEVADGGVALSDIALKTEVQAVSDLVGVIPDGYDATTIAEYAKELADNVAANGYDDTTIKGLIQDNTDAIGELETNKADVATTLEGYGITDAYTKTEVDSAITTAVANAEHLKRSIVDTLPEVASADVHTIYMVAITGGDGNQKYEEFMLINGVFEKIGDSAVDLTDYTTKTYVDGLNTAMDTRVTALETSLGESVTDEEIEALFS